MDSYFINPDLGRQFVTPPPPPPVTPIEKIEFTRIDAENKRKIADLQLQAQELAQKTQEMQLDFEAKIKEMALKYNTQLDAAKIKADADLDKMMFVYDFFSDNWDGNGIDYFGAVASNVEVVHHFHQTDSQIYDYTGEEKYDASYIMADIDQYLP